MPFSNLNRTSISNDFHVPLLMGLFLAVGLLACDAAGPTAETVPEASSVSLSLSAGNGNATASSQTSAKSGETEKTFTDAEGNSLRLDQVELVLQTVEFERSDDDCTSGEEEECEELVRGPLLVSLPLGTDRPSVVVDTTLPAGTWEEATFEVDEPSDASILEGTDFPADASIRAKGTYTPASGTEQSFTYLSDLSEERELEFDPPVEVTTEEPTNVTFALNVDAWFRTADSILVDPARANDGKAFEGLVEENIEGSIEGFEDDDRDGEEDGRDEENEGDDDEESEDDGTDDDGDDDDGDNEDGENDDDAEDEEEEDDEDDNEEDSEDDDEGDESDEEEVEVALNNSGPDPDADGEAEFEQEADRTEFKVEVEDLDTGTYDIVVADTARGQLDVTEHDDGTEGEIEFRDPAEPGHPQLDFDPRGQHIAVVRGGATFLEVDFPSTGDDD